MTDDLSVALKSLIAVGKNEFLNLFVRDLIEMNRLVDSHLEAHVESAG